VADIKIQSAEVSSASFRQVHHSINEVAHPLARSCNISSSSFVLNYDLGCILEILPPSGITLHYVFGQSQTFQILTKHIGKTINNYETRYMQYENILYSLRPILLFANMDVCTTKICLDTSILAKSNMGRREYDNSNDGYFIL
jgi:hypothetical protein